ncbi:DUF2187 domain-containing protein [Lactobacillus xylocopicola]|uniref:DUF2187 domain-containing protein n=1 Tax=Lactobacillus xylocopicola TaxID=2976676 RepID=A0ABM8BIB9_9LACO|nr:DUF2187 domain-containing protein [Lactobacillus xylocopicola]BDR61045.1 hypothetical protein KIM322_13060 [Lactobacillus xylocopicola]
MKKADVKPNSIVSAKSEEELTKPFLGKVEKIYENSAMLAIIDFDQEDETAVGDLNKKIVVNFKNLKSAPKRKLKEIEALANSDVKVEKITPTKKASAQADSTTEKKSK